MNLHTHAIPRLGLTGGIGSGKSTALAYLSEMGAAVISSDAIVHELYEHPQIAAAIRGHFGPDVTGQGAMDRAALARLVFADDAELAWLEALLHPHVRRRIEEWAVAQEYADPQPALLAAEVPLLFETDRPRISTSRSSSRRRSPRGAGASPPSSPRATSRGGLRDRCPRKRRSRAATSPLRTPEAARRSGTSSERP